MSVLGLVLVGPGVWVARWSRGRGGPGVRRGPGRVVLGFAVVLGTVISGFFSVPGGPPVARLPREN